MKFLKNNVVDLLYNATINLDNFSTKQDKKSYLATSIQVNKEVAKLLSLLVSFYFEFYKNFKTKELIRVKSLGEDTLLQAIWTLYFDIDNFLLLKNKLKQLDPKVKFLLNKYVFGDLIKILSEDYFLSILSTYFTKERILKIIKKNTKIREDNLIEQYMEVNYQFNSKTASFPFVAFFIKSGQSELKYIYRKYENVFTNDKKSRKFVRAVKLTMPDPHFLVFYYKINNKGNTTYIPLVYTTNLLAIDDFLQNNSLNMEFFDIAKPLFKLSGVNIAVPTSKKIVSIKNLHKHYKLFFKPNLCFSAEGVFSLKLKTKFVKYPIIDIWTDKQHNPIGVIYVDKRKSHKFKTRVTNQVLDVGIKNFYLEGIKYYWGDTLIRNMPTRIKEGLVFTCPLCGESYSVDICRQGLCRYCYKKLADIAKYHIEDYFELPVSKITDFPVEDSFDADVEKYSVHYSNGILKFKKNLYLLKTPYQLYLPLFFN